MLVCLPRVRDVTTGTIFHVERFAVHDGPGIRTAVFLKGCPLRCWWCHSPESQARDPEPFTRLDRCIRCGQCLDACAHDAVLPADEGYNVVRAQCAVCGACARLCPSGARDIYGRPVTVEELLAEIERDVPFFDRSGGGVTFSGGEPLMQPGFLGAALAACRARRLHTAVETAGFAPSSVVEAVAGDTDLFLYDLKLVDDARHRRATGASNALILDNLRWLARTHPAVRVRVPLVPGETDDQANLAAIGALVASMGLPRVDLLPYHSAGLAKYRRLGREAPRPDVQPPSPAALAGAARTLESFGLTVHLGG